ncbi:MAG: HEPN domain-containing protein [Acidimicrobiia bacterium]
MTVLQDLLAQGLVEAVEVDLAVAEQWLADASRHLGAARRIADLDPSGAYVLAYDAARKSVAAALLKTGHRVKSRPGAHRALARYANSLANMTNEPALARFDRLRRNRNRSEYGSTSFGEAEVREAIATAQSIQAACSKIE